MFSKVQKRSCYKDRNFKEMVKISAKSHEVHHKGKKRIFHSCLVVHFLPEAEKIRPGVFRVASFTEDCRYLFAMYKATEKDTGFISVSLCPGSRQWNSWDHYNNLLAYSFLSPPVVCCFLPVPEERQHKGTQKQLLHCSQTRFI